MSMDQPYATRAVAETLQYELELQGIPSSLHYGVFPDDRPAPVFVLLDPFEYLKLEGVKAVPAEAVLRRTILVFTGPPPATPDSSHAELLEDAGAIFALDQRSVVDIQRRGFHVRLLRPGYSRSLDHFDAASRRPIDALFLGTHSAHRAETLSRAADVLVGRNCRFEVAQALPTAAQIDSPLAEGRWSLLTQSKILINLHHDDEDRLEWPGVLDAIHAGAVVVSEHSSGIVPLVPGEHLFLSGADALPYVVEALLADERRLARVRAQAYERLHDWIPYALWVSVLRAAVVELIGEPLPPEIASGATAA